MMMDDVRVVVAVNSHSTILALALLSFLSSTNVPYLIILTQERRLNLDIY